MSAEELQCWFYQAKSKDAKVDGLTRETFIQAVFIVAENLYAQGSKLAVKMKENTESCAIVRLVNDFFKKGA